MSKVKAMGSQTKLMLAVAGVMLGLAGSAQAAWITTAAGTYDYLAGVNWASGTIDDDFPSTLTLAGAQTLTFGSGRTTPGAVNFNYDGNYAMVLQATGTDRTLTLGGDVNLNTAGGTAANVTIGSTGTNSKLNVDLGGATRTFTVADSRTLTLTNVVSNGAITKAGAGTLTLSGANTYASGLSIAGGTVVANVSNATTVSGAAGPSANAITLGATGGSNPATLLSNGVTVSNAINLGTTTGALTLGNQSTNAGIFSGGVTGSNNLVLNNNSSGALTFSGGSLNNTGTISNLGTGTGATTISSVIGRNVGNVIQNGTSPLSLGVANSFFGNLIIKQGTVNLNAVGAASSGSITLGDSSGGNARLYNTTTLIISNAINLASGAAGSLSLWGPGGNNSGTTFSGAITLNGNNLTIGEDLGGNNGGGSLTISGGITGTGNLFLAPGAGCKESISLTTTLVNNIGSINNSGTGVATNTISAPLGAAVTSIVQGSTTSSLTLSGANTAFTGSVEIQKGLLTMGGTTALNSSNVVSVGTLANNARLDINAKNETIAGLNDYSTGGGTVTNSGAAATLTFNGSGTYSFSGNVTSTTPANLNIVKQGTGSQTLSGTNTYTGRTTVNAGTLTLPTFTHNAGDAASAIVNGTSLGSDSATSGLGRLFFTGTPTLAGTTAALDTGINSSAKNTQIIPFLVGEATTTTGGLGTATNTANTFVTYNALTGVRPLNPTDEFTNSAIAAGTNTYIKAATTAGTTAAINSLVINGADLTITDGQTLTDTSGALLFASGNTIKPSGTTGTLDFGSAEAFVTVTGGTGTISAPVTVASALTKSGTGALTISGSLTSSSNLTLANTSTGTLTGSGGITSTGAANLTLNANSTGGITLGATGTINNVGTINNSGIGTGTTTIGGIIGTNVTGVSQTSATSKLSLTGIANTFTGPVSVAAGATLTISGDGSLGNASNGVTLSGGGTLAASGLLGSQRTLTLNSGGNLGAGTYAVTGNITGTGPLAVNNVNSATVLLSGNNTYSGATNLYYGSRLLVSSDANIGGLSSTLAFAGTGGETFSILGTQFTTFGTRTVTFGVSNNNGTLGTFEIQDPNNTFNWNKNDNYGMNSGNPNIIITGQGTVDVTVPQTGWSDTGTSVAVTFNGGTTKVNAPAGGSLPNLGSNVAFGGGTFYLLGKTGSAVTQLMGTGVIVNAGGGTIVADNNTGSSTTTINLGTLTTYNAGSALNLKTVNPGTGSATINTTSTTANLTLGILSARALYNSTDWATVTTAVTNNTISAYSGYTTIAASGTPSGADLLNSQLTSTSGTGGAVTLGGAWTTNTLKVASGTSLSQGGNTLTLTTGGLLFTGADDYSITGGTLKSNTATNSDLVVHQYGTGALTISSVIANGIGTSTLTKAGSGKLVLTAANNTYTGQTYVNGGVLSVDAVGELGGTVTAALNLNGGTLQATNSMVTTHTVLLGGSGGTFDVATGKTLTLNGIISGAGLTFNNSDAGTGTVVLGAVNTFSSGVWINAGVVQLNNAAAMPANGFNTLAFGSGTTAKLQLNGNNATVAGLTSASTSAVIENTHATMASSLNVYNGADNTFAGTLQDGGAGKLALVKGGGAKLTLTGTNTYTGATTVSGGILAVNGSLTGSAVTVNAGKLGGIGTIAGPVTIASGGTLAAGNSVGTMNVGSLTMSAGSIVEAEFNGSSNDLTMVTSSNGLTLNGGSVYLYQEGTQTLATLATGVSYHLFGYAGVLNGDTGNLTVANDNALDNVTYSFETSVVGGQNYVDLVASIPEPVGLGLLALLSPMLLMRRRGRKMA